MATLQIRCSDALKDRLTCAAARADINGSELARAILERGLTQLEPSQARDKSKEGDDEALRKVYEPRSERAWARLTPSEMAAVTVRSSGMGMTPYKWIARLIRTHLTKAPELTHDETVALRLATRELNYVGRNLNQIAHTLNMTLNAREKISVELIAEINQKVAVTSDQVKAVLDQNLNRWSV